MNIKAKVYKKQTAIPSIKGVASITIDDCFVVKGILIMEGKNGLFMSMPTKKNATGEYKDICFPITKEARQQIIDEIMKQYNNLDEESKNIQQEREAIQNEGSYEEVFGGELPF